MDDEMMEVAEYCTGCGGGLDGHPSLCLACRYERAFPGRCYERDVDKAQKIGVAFGEYVRRVAVYEKRRRLADSAFAALEASA